MKIEERKIQSTDKIHMLYTRIYIPDSDIKGIVQIVHGMTEYIERYHGLMWALANEGYVVFGHNHIGHKNSSNDDDLGFIASNDGYKILVNDTLMVGKTLFSEYKDKKRYLFGHSMGSFIARMAALKYQNDLSGFIICGTGGRNTAAGMGIAVCRAIKALKGERYISGVVYSLAFSSYTKKFDRSDEYSWLTANKDNIATYRKDKYCTFKFTISAMQDLITLNKLSNEKTWFKEMSKTLPIFLIAGSDDPVGNYGKGVIEVYERLKKENCNAKIKLYSGMRHEILNDDCADETVADILKFIKEN